MPTSLNDIPLFSTLPGPNPADVPWSPNVLNAAERLSTIYNNARAALGQEADSSRLKLHYDLIEDEAILILEAMDSESMEENIPEDWIMENTKLFGLLATKLARAQHTSRNHDDRHIRVPKPVKVLRTGKRGRPAKIVDESYLREALNPERAITIARLTRIVPVHRNTLRKYMRGYGLGNLRFSRISNRELDKIVRAYRKEHPGSGLSYLTGHLHSQHGLRIQRHRILASIARVDGLGVILRRRQGIRRRKYRVSRPNALWHIDGHHKLILWGFIVHGIVDGYGRDVVAIRTSINNRASTVLENFLDATNKYGTPSRIRGDYGTENKLVALYMILKKGQNRGSFIWGSSTRNTRIERLWVEVGRQFARQWRAFFFRLEAMHGLVRSNHGHIWLLHYLFLESINDDCQTFQEEWNAHPISGEGHNMSPNDMRFAGMTTEGVYVDDCDSLTQEEMNDHYGVDQAHYERPRNQTGAGTLSDEEFSETDSLSDELSDDSDIDSLDLPMAAREVFAGLDGLMERVHVPRYPPPFQDAEVDVELFSRALTQMEEEEIPEGYGILPEEWENGEYPSYELLRSGKKGTRELRVDLPDHIWRPRVERWVKALHTLNYMLEFVVK
ncbi:hypothetical protein V5O48_008391 [Marasmius crinis-equi]|uniref:Integrase catalytic domain-containing protein n=1 Tax=Marasmius crinis-equi TaxID=585013 RepID=A0ABR3FE08_9AGAR